MSETVWISAVVKHETEKAVLLTDGTREDWIPKSQIIDQSEDFGAGVAVEVELPIWLAEKIGLLA